MLLRALCERRYSDHRYKKSCHDQITALAILFNHYLTAEHAICNRQHVLAGSNTGTPRCCDKREYLVIKFLRIAQKCL